MKPPQAICAAGLIAIAGLGLLPPGAAAARLNSDACKIVTVEIDTSRATSSVSPFLGEAPGQTFFAQDTLLRSLTVWRVAVEDTNYLGMHLYITKTDSTGKPLTDQVVLDGPTLYNYYGDGVHPIPFYWVFDPPVPVPKAGLYAFFLRMTPCGPGYFDVLARESSTDDLYSAGHYWRTDRSILSGCILRRTLYSNPLADIIFKLEFCTTTTPVRGQTWGQIKLRYR